MFVKINIMGRFGETYKTFVFNTKEQYNKLKAESNRMI